jgi:CheY-like chemotaxis protein
MRNISMAEHQHILIVDDDAKVMLIMRTALEKLGDAYKITTASDGREALAMTKNQSFDLIVSDVRMPGIDGIQLAHIVRDLNTETAIIWITAYGCEDLKAECERLNISGCLEKPLRINEIRRTVLAALEKQRHNQRSFEKQ